MQQSSLSTCAGESPGPCHANWYAGANNAAVRAQVWHPNISSQTGAICLDILKDQWSPALGIKTALMSLQLLMQCPAPDDPQDAQVAKQFINEPAAYKAQAAQWTSACPLLLLQIHAQCFCTPTTRAAAAAAAAVCRS